MNFSQVLILIMLRKTKNLVQKNTSASVELRLYLTWGMLSSFSKKAFAKPKHPLAKSHITCTDEYILFENFEKWLQIDLMATALFTSTMLAVTRICGEYFNVKLHCQESDKFMQELNAR